VERLLGTGAAGEVSLVHDSQSAQTFALKVLKDLTPASINDFEREVLFLSRLKHPGLVAIHGFSKEGPSYWMDFVEGRPLSEAASGASAEKLSEWLREALAALAYLHEQGILHGDLKPANLLINQDSHVKLVDFGLATFTSESLAAGKIKGSLPYLAPEILKGQRTPGSDLYALGTVFYEAVAKRHPRTNAATIAELFSPDFERLETLNLGLTPRMARIIDRLIEADPAVRFKSAKDVLSAFEGDQEPSLGVKTDSFRMRGRDREWQEALAFIETHRTQGGLILARGITGTGKTRFTRELSFHLALQGIPQERREISDVFGPQQRRELFDSLERGGFLLIEVNEDRIGSETSQFLDTISQDPHVLSLSLSPKGFLAETITDAKTLRKRLSKLSDQDRLVFQALCACEGEAPEGGVCFVTGLPPLSVSEALVRLSSAGLTHAIALACLRNDVSESIHSRWIQYWEERGHIAALAHHALHVSSHPKRQAWVLAAAETFEQRGAPDRAIILFERALSLHPTPEERDLLLRGLANALGTKGDWRRQLEILEMWFSEFPVDPDHLSPVKFHLASAVALRNLGKTDEAKRHLETCLTLGDPQRASHQPRLARAHSLLGAIAMEGSDWPLAREQLAQARAALMETSEQTAEIYLTEARLEAKANRWQQAFQAIEESEAAALILGSRSALFAAVLEKGNLSFKQKNFDDAESAYTRAQEIASDPRDELLLARVHQNRGILETRLGHLTRALDEFAAARRLLLFFGTTEEQAFNHLEHALAQASAGRFAEAASLIRLARTTHNAGPAAQLASETESEIASLQSGRPSTDLAKTREELIAIHQQLPDALKVSFEERPDFQKLVKNQKEMKETTMDILNRLGAIMRDLLTSDDVDGIMARILDGALELSRAERGFLVTRDEEIKAARNLTKDFLKGNEFKMSLSAVREVVQKGETVVTDNAALDPRFKTAASVQEMDLKSICVLPLKTTDGVVGVLYLDQPYQAQVFQGADLSALQMFADQAALALQKAKSMDEMKVEIVSLKKEVEEQRLQLTHEYAEIVGQARPMMEVLSLVDRLIDTSIPVWIFGESGTGKEAIARALHFKGPRARKPFVSENCSSLPEQLLESELFGHKRGSFTHADRDKKGLLHHADGGTVFLDEIADMSPQLQSKMLRFLQEGEIRPIGSNDVIKVDVRVVSASNKDLNALVHEGKFREDLFYRLNGMTVTLPPLRERLEDLPLLVQHFLKKLAQAEKKEPLEATPEALDLLMDYSWPGNVRELENTIRSAQLFSYKGKLLAKSFHFKKALFGEAVAPLSAPAAPAKSHASGKAKIDERQLLLEALKKTNFHKSEAAEQLGISRRYLYTQMEKFGIPTKRMAMKAYVEKELKGSA